MSAHEDSRAHSRDDPNRALARAFAIGVGVGLLVADGGLLAEVAVLVAVAGALVAVRSPRPRGAARSRERDRRARKPAPHPLEGEIRRQYARDAISAADFERRLSQLIERAAVQAGERFDPFGPLVLDGRWRFTSDGRLERERARRAPSAELRAARRRRERKSVARAARSRI